MRYFKKQKSEDCNRKPSILDSPSVLSSVTIYPIFLRGKDVRRNATRDPAAKSD